MMQSFISVILLNPKIKVQEIEKIMPFLKKYYECTSLSIQTFTLIHNGLATIQTLICLYGFECSRGQGVLLHKCTVACFCKKATIKKNCRHFHEKKGYFDYTWSRHPPLTHTSKNTIIKIRMPQSQKKNFKIIFVQFIYLIIY